jgi:hypothetical protein
MEVIGFPPAFPSGGPRPYTAAGPPEPEPMSHRPARKAALTAAVLALAGAGWMASPALGQPSAAKKTETRVEPPIPRRSDKPPTLWNYAVVILILLIVFGANVIPSKRGHQD